MLNYSNDNNNTPLLLPYHLFFITTYSPTTITYNIKNKTLKSKLTFLGIVTIYITLLVEYSLNPKIFYDGISSILPPYVVLRKYVYYNILAIGLPLAIFFHMKISNYQFFGYYGITATLEFAMALIIIILFHSAEITNFHSFIAIQLILITGFQIIDHEFDPSETFCKNVINWKKNKFTWIYFIYLILCVIALPLHWIIKNEPIGYLDNFSSPVYIITMLFWIASQWFICVSLSDKMPFGLDIYISSIFIASTAIIIIISNVYTEQ